MRSPAPLMVVALCLPAVGCGVMAMWPALEILIQAI
jgi:hypothetical protein